MEAEEALGVVGAKEAGVYTGVTTLEMMKVDDVFKRHITSKINTIFSDLMWTVRGENGVHD